MASKKAVETLRALGQAREKYAAASARSEALNEEAGRLARRLREIKSEMDALYAGEIKPSSDEIQQLEILLSLLAE